MFVLYIDSLVSPTVSSLRKSLWNCLHCESASHGLIMPLVLVILVIIKMNVMMPEKRKTDIALLLFLCTLTFSLFS